jgi:hypothetical protein
VCVYGGLGWLGLAGLLHLLYICRLGGYTLSDTGLVSYFLIRALTLAFCNLAWMEKWVEEQRRKNAMFIISLPRLDGISLIE